MAWHDHAVRSHGHPVKRFFTLDALAVQKCTEIHVTKNTSACWEGRPGGGNSQANTPYHGRLLDLVTKGFR